MRGAVMVFGWLLLAACADERACHRQMGEAQVSVNGVDSKSLDSLRASLTVVSAARAQCDKARLGEEADQLLKAENQLKSQIDFLEKRAALKAKAKPSAAELAELVKNGDPSCPKGQSYLQHETKREVKCSGPQIAEMNVAALKAYYGDRDFRLTTSDAPFTLKAEHRAEVYTFVFDKESDAMPRCLTAIALPGMAWQEVASRLTGVTPDKLELGKPIKAARGELALSVEHPENQALVRIGACGAAGQAAP